MPDPVSKGLLGIVLILCAIGGSYWALRLDVTAVPFILVGGLCILGLRCKR